MWIGNYWCYGNRWCWIKWFSGERGFGVHFLKWTWRVKPRLAWWPIVGFEYNNQVWPTVRIYLLFGRIYCDRVQTTILWPWETVE